MNRASSDITLDSQDIKILQKFFPHGIVAIDIETTGLSPIADRIIELAAIKLDKSGSKQQWYQLINPQRNIPVHTQQYHGIDDEMVKVQSPLEHHLPSFLKFWAGLPVVAHNAQFDLGFIIRYLHQENITPPSCNVYDSCRIARAVLTKGDEPKQVENYKLSTLAKFFNISLVHHRALDDAMASLKILAKVLAHTDSDKREQILKTKAFVYNLQQFKKSKDAYHLPKRLNGLNECIERGEEIQIDYQGGEKKGLRSIKPIALLPMPRGLVLYALCLDTGVNKHYLVKRIQDFLYIEQES